MSVIPNDKLIKRAKNGARNLYYLVFFALLVFVFLFVGYLAGELGKTAIINALWGFFTAISLFMLARATKKGNTAGLLVVAVIALVQVCFSTVMFTITFTSHANGVLADLIAIAISSCIAFSLLRARKNIIALKNSPHKEAVYGTQKSGRTLCILGSIIFITSYLLFFAGHYAISSMKVQKTQKVQEEQTELDSMLEQYLSILDNQEITFIFSLEVFVAKPSPKAEKELKDSLTQLRTAMLNLKQNPKSTRYQLDEIITPFLKAIDSWEAGVNLISSDNPDYENGHKLLAKGNEFRRKSGEKYNSIFTVPQK